MEKASGANHQIKAVLIKKVIACYRSTNQVWMVGTDRGNVMRSYKLDTRWASGLSYPRRRRHNPVIGATSDAG